MATGFLIHNNAIATVVIFDDATVPWGTVLGPWIDDASAKYR